MLNWRATKACPGAKEMETRARRLQKSGWSDRLHRWILFLSATLCLLLVSGCSHLSGLSTPSGQTPGSANASTVVPPGSDGILATPLPTTGCGKAPSPAPGTTAEMTLTSGGLQRIYRLHVPVGYDPARKTPLVLNLHGHNETALQQERYSQYSDLADQQHFLVVYPQGIIGPDNKLGWATYGKNDPTINDVLFFSDLLTVLQQHLCVDAQRIYATGISNGGGMTNLLACRMAGRIAAFAPVAAAIYPISEGCHPSRPVSYLEFHGTSDPAVHYNGSTLLQFPPVMDMLQEWATRDHCTSGPDIFFQQADVTGYQWTHCQAGVVVQHYRITGRGHTWPGATISTFLGTTTHTISATTLSWQFFQNARLP